MATFIQRNFAKGEITPSLYSRVDEAAYATGLRLLRNFTVKRHGGAESRPGSTFVAEVKDSTKAVRVIDFAFNSEVGQTYALEFGNQYIRFHKNGVQLTEAPLNVTAATNANPCVLTVNAHGYTTGQEVYVSGVLGMTQLNGRNFKVGVTAANTFQLLKMDGTNLDSTSFGAYVSGGTSARVYEIATSYLEADLFNLQYTQSADVITFVHPTYPPAQLSRTADTNWTFSNMSFVPGVTTPGTQLYILITGGGGVATIDTTKEGGGTKDTASGGTGAILNRYRVTAVADNGEESLTGNEGAPYQITAATNANPGVFTTGTNPHPFALDDQVTFLNIAGMTDLNGATYFINSVPTASTFTLKNAAGIPIDTTSFGVFSFVAIGVVTRTYIKILSTTAPSSSAPNIINVITGTPKYNTYNIYKELSGSNGTYGFIGVVTKGDSNNLKFSDIGYTPNTTERPPVANNPFVGVGNYPSAVGYVQSRLVLGNTNNAPEFTWMSQIGNYKNFTVRTPIQDDDSLSFNMTGRQVNRIKHYLDLQKCVVLTTGGVHSVNGDVAGVIKPTAINRKQEAYNGSSNLRPLIVDSAALYIQARANKIRDLEFNIQADGYRGNELTLFSSHLYEQYTLKDWAYQEVPNQIVWVVRSDGVLLGLTYVKEQMIVGSHHHDTDGTFESVCSVAEGTTDSLYFVVKRTINGASKRFIERANPRLFTDIVDYNATDCSLSYDGRNTNTLNTMTISGGTIWNELETLTLTAAVAATFVSTDVGTEIHLTGSDGTQIRFAIAGFSSGTVVTGTVQKTVPTSMRSTGIATWSKCVKTLTNLWHLEGKKVSVIGDGFVVASPNNFRVTPISKVYYPTLTVTNGQVTLDQCFGVIHAGLPYICDIETLDIDTAQGETVTDKKKRVGKITVLVENTRGVYAGAKKPTSDTIDPLQGLMEPKIRFTETYDQPVALTTGQIEIINEPQWNQNGRVFLRQVDPLPLTVLAIAPDGMFPFRGA